MVRQIDPDLVMKLRDEVPDKSRMDCKKALIQFDGDLEQANKHLAGQPQPEQKSKTKTTDSASVDVPDIKEDTTKKDDKK